MDMGALPGLGLCVEPVRYCSSSSPILLRLPLHRRCFWVLILQPVAGATSAISRTQALGDDALQPHLAGMLEHDVDGPPQRIRDKGQQHLPGDEAWLIGEHRPSGEKKYYLANLPAKTGLRMLAAIIKARWICEQAHQQLKEELGLDHFEGRSWQGLHRHALMTMIAYAFLQHRRLIRAKREKKNQRTTTSAKLASRAPRYRRSHHATASALPELPTMGPGGIAA
jgi:SRSO17 transposase